MSKVIAVIAIAAVSLIPCVSAILYFKKGWFHRFYHDVMHWHRPDDLQAIQYDGCSLHCRCKWCKKEIVQDSQGNWFSLKESDQTNI